MGSQYRYCLLHPSHHRSWFGSWLLSPHCTCIYGCTWGQQKWKDETGKYRIPDYLAQRSIFIICPYYFSGCIWHGTCSIQWGFLNIPSSCSPHNIKIFLVCHLLQNILSCCGVWHISWTCGSPCCLEVHNWISFLNNLLHFVSTTAFADRALPLHLQMNMMLVRLVRVGIVWHHLSR